MQRVLVVEDNDTVRSIYTRVLSRAGFDVSKASSTSDGVRAIREDPCDIALIDIRLDSDTCGGLQVAGAADRSRTWLVAISGSCLTYEEGDLAEKFDEVLEKPISSEELVSVVQKLASRGRQ